MMLRQILKYTDNKWLLIHKKKNMYGNAGIKMNFCDEHKKLKQKDFEICLDFVRV